MNDQIGMFQMLYSDFKFTKEVREIETFAGYGSQRMSLKRLNDKGLLKSKSWKTVEWEYHAIRSYYEVHCADDKTDYAKDMTYDELLAYFKDSGISADGKKPMTLKQIIRKGEKWMREIYNKIKATKNLVDITKVHSKDLEIVDKDKYQYILTYSFPCQDLSKAGKQQGMAKGSGTRSGMLWEIERIIGECYRDGCLPDVLKMENVPDVIGSKNMKDFMKWYAALEAVGYQSYYKTLNAKDYGVPQNRDRCFMVSILGDYNYSFPKKMELNIRLKDILEKDVDEKYYISQEKINYMKTTRFCSSNFDNVVQQKDGICSTLCVRDYKDPKCVQLGNLQGGKWDKEIEQHRRIYSMDGLSPTLTTRQNADEQPKFLEVVNENENYVIGSTQKHAYIGSIEGNSPSLTSAMGVGGGHIPMITEGGASVVIPEATAKGYTLANDGDYVNLSYMESNTRRGRVGKGVSQTLLCNDNNGVVVEDSKEVYICAQRGRNPDNPKSRKVGLPTEQMIEINKSGCSNTLTTVQKDNLVCEASGIYLNDSEKFHKGPIKNVSRTLKANKHDAGVIINEMNQMVRVRKYDVNTEKLAKVLRFHKNKEKLSNKDIAASLNLPITKVEHWFRSDKSFAIPNEDVWKSLKQILNIKTSEFDESIMTFEERINKYEKSNRVYHDEGIAPTLTSASADEKITNNLRIRKLTPRECGRLMGVSDEDIMKMERVNSNSQLYKQFGNSIVVDVLYYIFKQMCLSTKNGQ